MTKKKPKRNMLEKHCERCRIKFFTYATQRRFCCEPCANAAYNERCRDRAASMTKTCAQCGSSFRRPNWHSDEDWADKRLCSAACLETERKAARSASFIAAQRMCDLVRKVSASPAELYDGA